MDRNHPAVTPLRQRMLYDMRMRKLDPKTQQGYVHAVRKLAAFLRRSPDTTAVEDLRAFQLHLVDSGTSPTTLNATVANPEPLAALPSDRVSARPTRVRPLPITPGCSA